MPSFSSVQPATSKLSHHLDQSLDQTDDFSATFSFSCYCQINIGQRFVCQRLFRGLATDVSMNTAKTQFPSSPGLQTRPSIVLTFRFWAGSPSVCSVPSEAGLASLREINPCVLSGLDGFFLCTLSKIF